MAQDSFAFLVGDHVALSGASGPFRRCAFCQNDEGRVATGQGPHLASVVCVHCGSHVAWLSRDHLNAMAAQKRGAA